MNHEHFTAGREDKPVSPSVPSVQRSRRWGLWIAFLIVLLAAAGGGAWWWWRHSSVDWEAVYEQNNHAIAIMEGYHYNDAIPEFEKVIQMAPDWLPGRLNLGVALLNAGGDDPSLFPRCKATFEEVLRREPDNPNAHFCLGILLMHQKDPEEAVHHFEAVRQKLPEDAYTWYWLGTLKTPGSDEQTELFEQALKRNRHLAGAIYGLAMNLRKSDPNRAAEFLTENEALKRSDWENVAQIKYSRMGPLAEVIGRTGDPLASPRIGPLPLFHRREGLKVRLAPGTKWTTSADLGEGAVGEVRRLVRARFGATIVVLDYNRDGKPDLFLAGAVVEKGQVRDLLLRNDGHGRFTDVTEEAGLAETRPTLGCVVGDFDNDEKPDLLLTGVGVQKLFRNTGTGKFEDVTSKAGLDKITSVCLGAAFIDLDQDSDLDLLLCEYARNAEEAVKRLKGEQLAPAGGLIVFLHVGEAPETKEPTDVPPPLDCKFKRASLPELQGPAVSLVGLAASDMDGDRDLDLLVFGDQAVPGIIHNDRLLKFRQSVVPDKLVKHTRWNGALVLDVDHDGRSDLVLLPADQRSRVLLNRAKPGEPSVGEWFQVAETDAPPLRQATAVDLNLDSWTDVVGLSREGVPVLLVNEGGKLALRAEALGRDADWPRGIIGLAVCDADGDGAPDLFAWSEEDRKEFQLYDNRGNGGNGVRVELLGRNSVDGQNRLRCNADAIGVWAVAQAGDLWAGQENTTLCAGLGQSRQPLLFGIARHPRIEVLRMRWPDGTLQAEPDINDPNAPRDLLAGKLHAILQRNRMPGSCPILFAWDGRRFVFVNDFLGAGSVGEIGPDGTCRLPRPEESVKIETNQLVTRDGQYVLKITEPMDETTYLDRLELVVVDEPPGVRVYPDERFVTAGPPPSQELVAFNQEIYPVRAVDHRGRDVTQTLRRWDRVTVDDFKKRAWIGFAEEHAVELDFGDRLAAYGPNDRLYLCLAGWTEYPFPESSWAAHQAGVTEQWPILERQDEAGRWQSLGEAGFPAGLPRMMLVDVTGKVTGRHCRLRLRTNMQIYWDQTFIAPAVRSPRSVSLPVWGATLEAGRIVKEYSPDGRAPSLYDYDRHENVPLVRQSGRMTRYGDVTELLHQRDDRFVVFGPGDDLTVRFDARALPPLPEGWRRSFLLRTAGYCKDTALSTAQGTTVEPLPFGGMSNYPYGADQQYPRDPLHLDYLRRYLTREVRSDVTPMRGK
jgi:tetratricopeptide (TPR) repeat protein